MIDAATARSIALDFLAKSKNQDLMLLDGETIEGSFGWVFFYDTRRFVETGNALVRAVGNSPLIVDREDGSVHVTGTGHPIDFYVDAYERTRTVPRPTTWQRVP